jgi:chromate transport protein ChrA
MGLGLNFRRMINELLLQFDWRAAILFTASLIILRKFKPNPIVLMCVAGLAGFFPDVPKKANKRMVKPADMIKPTEEAFRLFRAAAT